MEPSIGKQLGLATFVWILYFLVVFLVCNFVYIKLRGQPPKNPDAPVILRGRPAPDRTVWQEKDKRLRRLFIAIGAVLMLLPLLLPLALKRFFS
ncbi:MAG: hypothetical protein HY283_04890 [Nitrospirae bacterium]|nr:hypothetical protein [Nitrospirota bacterium]